MPLILGLRSLAKRPSSLGRGSFFSTTNKIRSAIVLTYLPLMKLWIYLSALLACLPLSAATLNVNEIFVRLQGTIESGEGFDELVEDLENLENSELSSFLKEFDVTWKPLRTRYLREHKDFVEKSFRGEARQQAKADIRRHRSDFMSVYQLGEGPMKPLLKTKSMPAVKALRQLVMPTSSEIFATAPAALENQRKIILVLARFRDAVVDTAVLPDEEKARQTIVQVEEEVIASMSGLPREGIRIMKDNDKIAEKAQIPDDEREGIRELNQWRLLLGLNALVIDPKLSNACRGHSEDMHTNGFFAHESPLPGKRTPWDRAAKAGTTAKGENIYMGSTQPASANKGWFYSPGHHKNMFKASHTRIGLGRYQKHWTQCFG